MAKDKVDLRDKSKQITSTMNAKVNLARSLPEWRPILARECQVYVLGENYIAKRFDQINYRYCDEKEAITVVTNNVYALLRTKYFPIQDEEIDKRIKEIVSNFTMNLMTTLLKVTLSDEPEMTHVSFLPDYCIAFRNGVYDFLHNNWAIKYTIVKMPQIGNRMFLYEPSTLITWYLNFDFHPIEEFDIVNMSYTEIIDMFKSLSEYKETRSTCFELMYNIAHNEFYKFDEDKFIHLTEIMGFLLLQSFCQAFVMLIGAGANGKNSLFDGCFSGYVIPSITSNSLEDIEKDRFITGTLLNKYHNIFLETSAELHSESKMIKQITGSMYQTIEQKGIGKFSGILNVKNLFSCNDQDTLKFDDNTIGFRRRFNIYEIYYTWDSEKRFLKHGDFYDTTFSEDLRELKSNVLNAIVFCYMGMKGIMTATNMFTTPFKFTRNDWKFKYSDIDFELKDRLESIGYDKIARWLSLRKKNDDLASAALYSVDAKRLYMSTSFSYTGHEKTMQGLINMLNDVDAAYDYFNNNDVYISTKALLAIMHESVPVAKFNTALKKMYQGAPLTFRSIYLNTLYIRCRLSQNKLKVSKG